MRTRRRTSSAPPRPRSTTSRPPTPASSSASSGRAVLVAGSTVMIAMAGMFFAGLSIFTALGIGSIMVVAVAMIGSVTVLPPVLASLDDRMQAAFPGGQVPAVVAIEAKDVTTPQIAAATKELGDKAIATGKFDAPLSVDVSPDKHVAMVSIPMQGDGTNSLSQRALDTLRGGIVDETVAKAPGVEHAYITGVTAGTQDFNSLLKSKAPIVFAFVLTLAFLLLLVTFRSIVIPIKAIVLNLLSVGASYG